MKSLNPKTIKTLKTLQNLPKPHFQYPPPNGPQKHPKNRPFLDPPFGPPPGAPEGGDPPISVQNGFWGRFSRSISRSKSDFRCASKGYPWVAHPILPFFRNPKRVRLFLMADQKITKSTFLGPFWHFLGSRPDPLSTTTAMCFRRFRQKTGPKKEGSINP